jgi:hypothetical protein
MHVNRAAPPFPSAFPCRGASFLLIAFLLAERQHGRVASHPQIRAVQFLQGFLPRSRCARSSGALWASPAIHVDTSNSCTVVCPCKVFIRIACPVLGSPVFPVISNSTSSFVSRLPYRVLLAQCCPGCQPPHPISVGLAPFSILYYLCRATRRVLTSALVTGVPNEKARTHNRDQGRAALGTDRRAH